jgi:hypothetical protein
VARRAAAMKSCRSAAAIISAGAVAAPAGDVVSAAGCPFSEIGSTDVGLRGAPMAAP